MNKAKAAKTRSTATRARRPAKAAKRGAKPASRPAKAAKPGARPAKRGAKPAKRPTKAAAKNPPRGVLVDAEAALRAYAMSKPAATEHFPWGERAIKVQGKAFVFMHGANAKLSLTTKLPRSHGLALLLPFAQPAGYGLGKAGWVTATFESTARPPVELLYSWIDESYRALAPAKLAARASISGDGIPPKRAREARPRR